ncbi:MAG: DNA topology modulation protein FlaR [Eubacterium sp.]|nr:DNA topology modulation protein FlaR [Eubacterium sp.]MDE6156160.1 DNA topology modulation protein FlaR [Eubacterium sp.]
MKIAVLGYSGAGKSILAKMFGEHYDIPVLHLDKVQFLPNWKIRDEQEKRKIVFDFMQQQNWVIDGNYSSLHKEKRLEQADIIIILSFNRLFCFKSALNRYFENKGHTRPDMADGCNEKFDLEFALWILFWGRTYKCRKDYKKVYNKYRSKTLWFTNRRQVIDYVDSLK